MIVVVGGTASHRDDRRIDPAALRPIQAVRDGNMLPVTKFPCPPGRGVSNVVDAGGFLIWSSGDDLMRTELDGATRSLPVDDLSDVHELTLVDDAVLIANTGRDEVVAFDPNAEAVIGRHRLGVGPYHLNQAFAGLDGGRYGLVHHVSGRQLHRRVSGRLLKMQGDGGVISLDDGTAIPLRLTAPHSARTVGGELWILDSGRARIVRYDERWRECGTIGLSGWGRGAVLDAHRRLWVGVSPLRPRYRGFVHGGAVERPAIEVIDTEVCAVVERFEVGAMDQISGVHDLNLGSLVSEWCS